MMSTDAKKSALELARAISRIDRQIDAHKCNIELLKSNFPEIGRVSYRQVGKFQRRAIATIANLNEQIRALDNKKMELLEVMDK